ncbi:MAG TPA: hypothetical protein VH024_04035, partial [Candidatus Angelobacter sp.]|nr:hypothetical protein [Candidatus Angelobacter sp.]
MSSRPATTPQPAPATENGPQAPITRDQIEQALWVAFCGALGGLLFWLLGKWSGTDTFAYWKWYGQILALAFLG